MKRLFVLLLALNLGAAEAKTWFGKNTLTNLESISPEGAQLKVTQVDDGNANALPVGTILKLDIKKWYEQKTFSDEKVAFTITEAKLPDGKTISLNKEVLVKPRSTVSRLLVPFLGVLSNDMHLAAGDKILIFDEMANSTSKLTAIEDSTMNVF